MESGGYRQMREPATIRDVASAAAVSVATVSRYLNRTHYVSPEAVSRIEAAMQDLDYIPQTSARNLATRKTWTIGLLMEYIAGDFFGPFLNGVEDVTFGTNYSLSIASTHRWKSQPMRMPTLGPQNCDGVILFSNSVPPVWLERWHRMRFPLVMAYQTSPPGMEIPSVGVENAATAAEAVNHLIRVHGRRRIVFLKGQDDYEDSRAREAGYSIALAEAGLPFDPALVLQGDFNNVVSRESVTRALKEGLSFDAVFAADDDSAFGAMEALAKAGIAVPGRVSVIGFDDQAGSARSNPPLTTVRAPTFDVGRIAAETLMRLIDGLPVNARTVLPTNIHYRASCGCQPQNP